MRCTGACERHIGHGVVQGSLFAQTAEDLSIESPMFPGRGQRCTPGTKTQALQAMRAVRKMLVGKME
jgi:hypothetical protein